MEEKNEQIRGELETMKKTAEQRDIDFQALETDLRGKLMTAKEENEASNTKRQELEEEKKNVFEELTAAKSLQLITRGRRKICVIDWRLLQRRRTNWRRN